VLRGLRKLGIIINPFTGDLDFTGSGGSSPSGPAERYTQSFNTTTDWGSPSLGLYTIAVSAGTHGKGIHPNILVFELTAGNYEKVEPNSTIVDSSGNISITTLQSPDTRFAGLILII
jgi:hypothetical protein